MGGKESITKADIEAADLIAGKLVPFVPIVETALNIACGIG